MAIVWAIEIFRKVVYGTQFQVVSDHESLTSFSKGKRVNKTYYSRLTRWVDRLLPFQFTVTHAPGGNLRMAEYLSRHPSPSNKNVQVKAEELWTNWFTVNKIKCGKIVSDKQTRRETENQPITAELIEKSDRDGPDAVWTPGPRQHARNSS